MTMLLGRSSNGEDEGDRRVAEAEAEAEGLGAAADASYGQGSCLDRVDG